MSAIPDKPVPSARPLPTPAIVGITAGGIVALLIVGYFIYPLIFAAQREVQREVQVQTAVSQGDAAKAGVSEKNREASKAALNAIGELESVTSVGTNYQQYTGTLQSAKIKFDAAIRDLKPIDAAEFAILSQLEEAMLCHVDAKNAWTQFIQKGENSFLDASNYTVSSLATKYGFRATSQFGYYDGEVLQAIWAKASEKFRAAESQIRESGS